MRKRLLMTLLVCLCVLLLVGTVSAASVVASGECGAEGDNVTWTLDSDGKLLITGTGDMADYRGKFPPWVDWRDQVKTVEISEGVTRIGDDAFFAMEKLTDISIGNSLESIGEQSFAFCTSLTKITLPEDCVNVDSGAFLECSNLACVQLSSKMTVLSEMIFQSCTSLQEINIPAGLQKIESFAFMYCTSLAEIELPEGLEYLSGSSFSGCTSLKHIVIPCVAGSSAFSDCTSLKTAVMLNRYTVAQSFMFQGCTSLETVVLPADTQAVGVGFFSGCTSLTTIEIPAGTQDIGGSAFYGCTGLREIWFHGPVPKVEFDSFRGVNATGLYYYEDTTWNSVITSPNWGGGTFEWVPFEYVSFDDLDENAWYMDGVSFCLSTGLMNGMSDTEFGPSIPMTRGMLVTILYRAAGEPDVTGVEHPFTDVAPGRYYSEAVAWAYGAEVVNGMTETTFEPDRPVTREQLVTIFYRIHQAEPVDKDCLAAFPDADQVNKYAKDSFNWAVDFGLINGNTRKNDERLWLDPQGTATRAQIATILMRYLTAEE